MPKSPGVETVLFGAFAVALLVWPASVAYTLLAGDRATAHVVECHDRPIGRGTKLACTGTWRTRDGVGGPDDLYNLDRRDVGHDVTVRSGPFGLYGHGLGRAWPGLLGAMLGPLLFGARFVTQLAVIPVHRRRRDEHRAALAALGAITVTRGEAWAPDGTPLVTTIRSVRGRLHVEGPDERTLIQIEALGRTGPEGQARDDGTTGPEGQARDDGATGPVGQAGADSGDESGWALYDADGAPLGRLASTLDVADGSLRFELLGPSDAPVVVFALDTSAAGLRFAITDATGRQVGSAWPKDDKWLVRVDPGVDPWMRNVAVAFALIRYRTS
ncbi:hypothetical protein [Actinomadura oligospora]|uniref:hypothetical protein n=1 Tax=Actinomadura oligospora TaxID=111804 RepID=UPI000478785F|nr:hypothetical protein [Actinomadura oligospora]